MEDQRASETPQLGDLIYVALEKNVVFETADWAFERVDRALTRIQSGE